MKPLLIWREQLLETGKQCALLVFSITLLSACARLEYVPQKKFYSGDNAGKKSEYLGTLYLNHGNSTDDEWSMQITRRGKMYSAETTVIDTPVPTNLSLQAGGGDVRAGFTWTWKFNSPY